jgi:hypothetical protein
MNDKRCIIPIFVLCIILNFSHLCASEYPKDRLVVKQITLTRDKIGGEWISIFCNQSCTPELFSLEENPRIVMDMKRVFLIQTKSRNINTGGRLVKRIRSYLDKRTNVLRIVLDMEPSKSFIVHPMEDPFNKMYVLKIEESEQKPEGTRDPKRSLLAQKKRITITHPDPRPGEPKGNIPQAEASPGKPSAVEPGKKDAPSVEQVRPQLKTGELTAALDKMHYPEARCYETSKTSRNEASFRVYDPERFTQILADHPQDFLSYRMRGNVYDNLGDQQKALADWMQAARLGDNIIQSCLDTLEIKWRDIPAP